MFGLFEHETVAEVAGSVRVLPLVTAFMHLAMVAGELGKCTELVL